MADGFRLNCLQYIEKQDLSQPFMLEEAGVWEEDERSSSVISQEIKDNVYNGEIELINIGCGLSYGWTIKTKPSISKIMYMNSCWFSSL